MKSVKKLLRPESGIALLTTLLLMLLMSSLLVGFVILISSGQKVSGINNDYSKSFYAAEAGMEKLTADIGTLFDQNYAPSGAQVNNLQLAPPSITGISYTRYDGTNGYTISYPTDNNGNPLASVNVINSGAYQGMTAMETTYTLNVTARTTAGSETKLQRTTQTVGIPMFQFGVFSDPDLSFHAGPNFNFGGRVHTNGNLFLSQGDGTTLTMSDKVTAVKDVIRTNLADGWLTSSGYNGTVNITTSPGSSSYRAMGMTEGSLVGMTGTSPNPAWPNISLGSSNYAGNVRNGLTGAKSLNLAIVTLGAGATQSIDIIRRPVQNEVVTTTAERFFSQAGLKILLSDDPNDIMNLPCIDTSTQPFDLSQLAQPVATWPTTGPVGTLKTNMTAAGTTALPLSASGAAMNTTNASSYNAADGYWLPYGYPVIKGYLKIEAQRASSYATPCAPGAWQDVTLEILGLGYVGKNLNPYGALTAGQFGVPTATTGAPEVGLPATGQLGANPLGCANPHPNAVIRLERVRDNPSTWTNATSATKCGTVSATSPPSDFWPNSLFDTREGEFRDAPIGSAPYNNLPTVNGVMYYVELDATNLAKWFAGTIGSTGPSTKDPVVAPNNFVVYFSDRRGNYAPSKTWTGNWPPLSPQGHETGEYGWTDVANRTQSNGCSDSVFDPGEDLDGVGQPFTYGANATHTMAAGTALASLGYGQYGVYNGLTAAAFKVNPGCAIPPYSNTIWPMNFVGQANDPRENPALFFRRALKIVNGKLLTGLGPCPGGVVCGLTIAAENPVYIQGDYNANSAGGGFNDANVAASVLADSITFLSNSWNDVNSFSYNEYLIGAPRNPTTTYYRTAAVAGKGIAFPYFGSSGDNGSDGGVHNFLRYIENWGNGGLTLYYRGSIVSMYFNRQATGIFKCCTTVYTPPNRGYNFDTEFLTPSLLPPRTPLFRDVNTTGFTQLLLPTQ